mmetsp:Transcript_12645/g.50551  ORF Transcript_12645/g.50551 Transcript_12645/m.50551 type:complete len:210 (-) Transcript_12645:405-1034(-)
MRETSNSFAAAFGRCTTGVACTAIGSFPQFENFSMKSTSSVPSHITCKAACAGRLTVASKSLPLVSACLRMCLLLFLPIHTHTSSPQSRMKLLSVLRSCFSNFENCTSSHTGSPFPEGGTRNSAARARSSSSSPPSSAVFTSFDEPPMSSQNFSSLRRSFSQEQWPSWSAQSSMTTIAALPMRSFSLIRRQMSIALAFSMRLAVLPFHW